MRKRTYGVLAGVAAIAALVLIAQGSWSSGGARIHSSKWTAGDPDSARATPGEGPIGGYDAYLSAERTYPANVIPPAVAQQAAVTFDKIAKKDKKNGDPKGKGHAWELYGPKQDATQPGVTAFSGATNSTASRITALLVSPDCGRGPGPGGDCRVWAGASGGGVWRTDHALDPNPDWKQLKPNDLEQNSVGALTFDPTDKRGPATIYLGTGEGNRCSSGCEAGVGIYKSNNGGDSWTKLADACVSNATYTCAAPGQDAFLGRGINSIVIDPRNKRHIFVGSALGVRGLAHTIGSGSTSRFEPGANAPGLYESTDGGATFTEVWNGDGATFGVTDVGLDPLNLDVVYAAAFDHGAWRRDAGAGQTTFSQVFAPQFPGGGTDRTMFALTVKNGHTRIYLTDGTAPATPNRDDPRAANFWRTDNANQSAATLLASQGTCTAPDPATNTFPATFSTWQCLTSSATASPYFAPVAFCTQQCWYDQDVYTPAGMPDTVVGSSRVDLQACKLEYSIVSPK